MNGHHAPSLPAPSNDMDFWRKFVGMLPHVIITVILGLVGWNFATVQHLTTRTTVLETQVPAIQKEMQHSISRLEVQMDRIEKKVDRQDEKLDRVLEATGKGK